MRIWADPGELGWPDAHFGRMAAGYPRSFSILFVQVQCTLRIGTQITSNATNVHSSFVHLKLEAATTTMRRLLN